MKNVRDLCVRPILAATLLVALTAVPSASASKPGDTEHGVNRDKLIAQAEQIVEERNGIDVLKISKCGPQKRKGKLNYSTWICLWRAEGTNAAGDIDYACAGSAVYKRKSRTWIVDRCENTRQPAAPLLATPNPTATLGFNDDWIFHSVAALNLLDETGSQVARTTLAWSGVEPTKGQFNWYGSDVLYQRLLDRGIHPLWILLSAPCYSQADPEACQAGNGNGRPRPDQYDELADFAVTAAKRYPESIGFEVWNEPNYPKFWGGPPDPAAYADMLNTVADALHERAPGTTVVSAGLSPHADTDTSGSIGFRDFLIEMYERGAAQKADAIGIHPYPGVGPDEDYLTDVRVYLGKVQNVMDRYGDGDRPLWATEFGASTGGDKGFSPQQAGVAITEMLDMFRYIRGIQMTIIHSFLDPALAGREGGFGMLNRNLTPKPAFCDLGSYLGLSFSVC
jgi:hypothetical protein